MSSFLWGVACVVAFVLLGSLFAWCASRLGAQADRDRDRALAELDHPTKVVPIPMRRHEPPYGIVVRRGR